LKRHSLPGPREGDPSHEPVPGLPRGRTAAGSGILAESERNRVLRRSDWRFLLPDPNPAKTICFATGLLLESVRQISSTVVEPRASETARDCDLAVAVDPDAKILSRASAALKPGGVLYCEWTRFGLRGRNLIRRRLTSAGLEDVVSYWPDTDPSVANPEAWLPLESKRVLRHYFVQNRGKSRTAFRQAVRGVLRRGRALAPRFRLARPICSVARKPSQVSRVSGHELRELVRARWGSFGLGPVPTSLSWLLLTGGLRSTSKVILLGFAHAEGRPTIAVKMPRMPDRARAVEREGEILRALQTRLDSAAPAGIPRALLCERVRDIPVLVETAFTGVPLLSAWTGDNYGALALQASRWLADLAGNRPPIPAEKWRPRLVDAVVSEFASNFGAAVDRTFLRDLEAELSNLPSLPLACEQRDFSPWNVLLTPEGELAVVDWESAEIDGLPALDLIYFLVNCSFSLDRARRTGRYRESYRKMLDPSTETGSVYASCLDLYCREVGVDPSGIPALRLLTWLVHSRSDYRLLYKDEGGKPEPEILRQSPYFVLCEEELRRRV
jgi:phosphotransferase family enzyme